MNGPELANVCSAIHPDLVIIDLEMPDDGFNVWLICSNRTIPTIVVTNRDYRELQWMVTGDDTLVLIKPFAMDQLRSAIDDLARVTSSNGITSPA